MTTQNATGDNMTIKVAYI